MEESGPKQGYRGSLEQIDKFRWRIPRSYKKEMKVEGIIYASERLIAAIRDDQAPEQVANVACLPGIVGSSMAMPDIHYGYGFPIGGVAAMEMDGGVISPGGVGYDINCGVRLLTTTLRQEDLKERLEPLVEQMFVNVPSGVGKKGGVRLSVKELAEVMVKGAQWAVARGFGRKEDLEHLEERGALKGADPSKVSDRAVQRGQPQLGTLGAGNHFLEIQVVEEIYEPKVAAAMGVREPGQVTVMIHTGSRGFGYQVCDDYLVVMQKAVQRYGIALPDRQLACAPIGSPEAKNYLSAMACAANYAWANRQFITHWVREAFEKVFGVGQGKLGLDVVYDVTHNIAKIEKHMVDGKEAILCVHRKGATRAFPPGHPDLPADYREIGQPVLVPGDMGRNSYLLVGAQAGMEQTFGSTCHGAGRLLSRTAALRKMRGEQVRDELAKQGIVVRSASMKTLAEEMPAAYKDVSDVVEACHGAGISLKVAKMRPLGVVKG
jgi:tRNA-splicing ligase RtcB